jgi:hypothetical protein
VRSEPSSLIWFLVGFLPTRKPEEPEVEFLIPLKRGLFGNLRDAPPLSRRREGVGGNSRLGF